MVSSHGGVNDLGAKISFTIMWNDNNIIVDMFIDSLKTTKNLKKSNEMNVYRL